MRRMPIELLVGLDASTLIALVIVVAGGAIRAAPLPLPSAPSDQAGCWDARLVTMDHSGVTGLSRLCTPSSGTQARMQAEGLRPGVAYTAWFVYFDQPRECRVPRGAVEACSGQNLPGLSAGWTASSPMVRGRPTSRVTSATSASAPTRRSSSCCSSAARQVLRTTAGAPASS